VRSAIIAAVRHEIASLFKSIVRLLEWGIVIITGWGIVHYQVLTIHTSVAFGLMLVSLFAIAGVAKARTPGWKTRIATLAGVMLLGIVAVVWVPQWSGYVVAVALVLFVFVPAVLSGLATRRAGSRVAAFYARLAYLLQPSRQTRFQSSFMRARALASMEERIAAFRNLASRASAQYSALLNCWISFEQADWEGIPTACPQRRR
jgi:hypothetical protein